MDMKDEHKLMTPAKEQEIKALIADRDTSGVTDYEVINIPPPPKPSADAKLVAKIAEEMRLKYSKINENSSVLKAEFKPVAPTRFADKVEWLKSLYAKREKFKLQRQKEMDLRNFQMADVDLRQLLDVRSDKEKLLDLERAEALAREENAIMKEWEIINDRNLYNNKCIENLEADDLLKALEYSILYRDLCLPEKYEAALIREKKILRQLGQDFRIGAGSKEGSKKYMTPIEIHNDLFKLKTRNRSDPGATLTSPRPKIRPIGEGNANRWEKKPTNPVQTLIVQLEDKKKEAAAHIKLCRIEKKKQLEIVRRNLNSLNGSKIFSGGTSLAKKTKNQRNGSSEHIYASRLKRGKRGKNRKKK